MQERQGISIFPQHKSPIFYRAQMSSGQRRGSLWVLCICHLIFLNSVYKKSGGHLLQQESDTLKIVIFKIGK